MANIHEPIASVGGSIARPEFAMGNDEPNRISNFTVAGSYNWLDEKNPTIMVPGENPVYSSSHWCKRFTKA